MPRTLWLTVFAFLLLACGGGSSPGSSTIPATGGSAFVEISPIAFTLQNAQGTLSFESSPARIFHTYFPADVSPETKPLFVLFNGGPGCATATGLFSLNTGPQTLDGQRTGGGRITANATSWTALGNVLYIDAPATGFSYNLVNGASQTEVRKREFSAKNFNPFVDAAQYIRVVLRFLASHPELRSNPVIMTGESYGGIRATVILHLILNYARYRDGNEVYRDPGLAAELQQHFDAVFPDQAQTDVPPATIARQFGRQILVQPLISGNFQNDASGSMFETPSSPLFKIARQTGVAYRTCAQGGMSSQSTPCDPVDNAYTFVTAAGRDVYNWQKQLSWLDSLSAFAAQSLQQLNVFAQATAANPLSLPNLPPADRENAYKYVASAAADNDALLASASFARLPAAQRASMTRRLFAAKDAAAANQTSPDTLAGRLGSLPPWDDYITTCNSAVLNSYYDNEATELGFDIGPQEARYGDMFLRNLAFVDTFMTAAALDLIIYTPAIPEALRQHNQIVARVDTATSGEGTGTLTVHFQPGVYSDLPNLDRRVITHPAYSSAGHAVSASEPEQLLQDAARWLAR